MDTKKYIEPSVFETEEWDSGFVQMDISDPTCTAENIHSYRRFIVLITVLAGVFVAGVLVLVSSKVSFSQEQNQSARASIENGVSQKGEALFTQQAALTDSSADNLSSDGECQVSAGYPNKVRRWCGIITEYSGKRDLPPDLVAAVILQESGGNPAAFSHSGAVGLMQVMPSDGPASAFMCANGPCFASRPRQDELLDPEFNVSYGTRMLAGLVRKHGSLREALKSYGPLDGGYYYADKVLGIYKQFGG
jgi:soluble lytic murein transglycosylase-like protein